MGHLDPKINIKKYIKITIINVKLIFFFHLKKKKITSK